MPVIDLSFVLVGTTIPLDHGYSLFSSICRIVPSLHGDRRIGIHPIKGRQSAPGVLSLTDRYAGSCGSRTKSWSATPCA
jgi:CRISPR-associated protein Cas6